VGGNVRFRARLMAVMLPVCAAALALAIIANVVQTGLVLSADPIKLN